MIQMGTERTLSLRLAERKTKNLCDIKKSLTIFEKKSCQWAHIICIPPHVQSLGRGTNGKDPKINIKNQKLKTLIFKN